MGNSKKVGGIAIGIAIVAIIAVYALNQDQSGVSNEIKQDSSVAISDSATLTQNNPDYKVDEEGNKKYTISASDSPIVKP